MGPPRAMRARAFQTTATERLGQPLAYSRGLRVAITACTLLGAAILVAAEFSTLYTVRAAGHSAVIQSTTAGADNSYALIPLAVLAVVLGVAALADGAGRWVVAALMLAGVIALLIGLLHDLPAAHRTGFVGSFHTHLTSAASSPGAGMYMETLGAVLLIVAGGLGLLFGEPVEEVRPSTAVSPPPRTARAKGPAEPAKRPARSGPAGKRPAAGGGAKRPAGSRAKSSAAASASGGPKRSAGKTAAGSKRSSTAAKRSSAAGGKAPSTPRRKPAQGSEAKEGSGSGARGAQPAGAKRTGGATKRGGGAKRGGGGGAQRGSGGGGQRGAAKRGSGGGDGSERGTPEGAQPGSEATDPPLPPGVSEN